MPPPVGVPRGSLQGGMQMNLPVMQSPKPSRRGGSPPPVAATPRVPVQQFQGPMLRTAPEALDAEAVVVQVARSEQGAVGMAGSGQRPFTPWLSPRPGTSSPQVPNLLLPASSFEAWAPGPPIQAVSSNTSNFGGAHKQTNSAPDLLPPWPVQPVGMQLLPGMPPMPPPGQAPAQSSARHAVPPQPPAPMRMLSAGPQAEAATLRALEEARLARREALSNTHLSQGPQVDWTGVEDRWYRKDFTEGKVRGWLATISLSDSDGPDRGWDDQQIFSIVQFAQDARLQHLSAEEIYRRYVLHQVEMADLETSGLRPEFA